MKPIRNNIHSRAGAGFTLIELLISIALVVMLLYGINKVFGMTSQTIREGVNVATRSREQRSAQSVIEEDLRRAAPDGACLIIDSGVTTTRRNSDATADEQFRIDLLSFFARGNFRAQTGNNVGADQFVAPLSSHEAWIVYGHLRQYASGDVDDVRSYKLPGVETPATNKNPNNYYASQWVLGRNQILLREPVGGQILDEDNKSQNYLYNKHPTLSKFSRMGSAVTTVKGGYDGSLSRSDLAGTSIDTERTELMRYTRGDPSVNWWKEFMLVYNSHPGSEVAHHDRHYRFSTNRNVSKPLTASQAARISPCFIESCSNFIIEYAGDYLAQDAQGQITGLSPDGQVDFLIVDGVSRVRWYGFPRDTNGDGIIVGGFGQADPNNLVDVVPLRDVRFLFNPGNPSKAPDAFEKVDKRTGYESPPILRADYSVPVSGKADKYICAWGPTDPRPRMIRITYTVEPPQASNLSAHISEHIVELP